MSLVAPVSTPPPVFFNLGIPTPAKIPPSWGAEGTVPASRPLPPASLLLLPRLDVETAGTGGAKPAGGFGIPGTRGAPVGGPVVEGPLPLICGADRSFVTAFLSFAPFVMSVRSAPFQINQRLRLDGGGMAYSIFSHGRRRTSWHCSRPAWRWWRWGGRTGSTETRHGWGRRRGRRGCWHDARIQRIELGFGGFLAFRAIHG